MNAHGKAYHIDCLLYVGFPVAALLAVINLVDDNVVLFLAVGRDIERREPGFASVLRAGEEVENLLFLAHDALLLFSAVGNIYYGRYNIHVLLEHGSRVDGKRGTGFIARQRFNEVIIKKVHNLLIFQRSYGPYEVSEKTLIVKSDYKNHRIASGIHFPFFAKGNKY